MSNEWLTTGQMIDRLKVGEVAQSNDDVQAWYTEDYLFFCGTNKAEGDCYNFQLDPKDFTGDRQWRILPNYVSFEEAMKALKEGKKITLHFEESDMTVTITRITAELHPLTFEQLLEPKWTIEADTP